MISRLQPHQLREVRFRAIQLALHQARSFLATIQRPLLIKNALYESLPPEALDAEYDSEASWDEDPRGSEIWMEYRIPIEKPVLLIIDLSRSMEGEKFAFTSIALASVLLQLGSRLTGVVVFENDAETIHSLGKEEAIEEVLDRFFKRTQKGYTNMESGLKRALKEVDQYGKPCASLLLSDGRFTAGFNPVPLAARFTRLDMVRGGWEKAGEETAREIVARGHGKLWQFGSFAELPLVLYQAIRELIRANPLGSR